MAGTRTGDLDPTIWGVSRTGTADLVNTFYPSTMIGCSGGTVSPPRDVQVCGGQLHESTYDNGGQTTLAMYPKQPFDIAGRTGTVAFDVTSDTSGPHAAWPEFWYTDQPVPAPHGEMSAQEPYARNSFGFAVDEVSGPGSPAYMCGDNQTFIDSFRATRNYVVSYVPTTITGCMIKSSAGGPLNHVEVRISQNHIEVWGSDPGGANLHKLSFADNANLTFTRGVVWLEDVHYNACKFDQQCNHTFVWDNLGFDGPKPYRDLTYDVADKSTSQLGYQTPTATLPTVQPVTWVQTPTTAEVTFNWFPFDPVVPGVSVNGGPVHTVVWPGSDTFAWRTIAIPVPLAEIHQGVVNTITLSSNGGQSTVVANINLALIAAAPVP